MKFSSLLISLFFFYGVSLHAKTANQEKDNTVVVRGIVVSSEGEPIEDAVIRCSKPEQVVFSDAKGSFSIRTTPGTKLVLQRMGYHSKEIVVDSSYLRITLEVDAQQLDEVTIVSSKNINDIDLRKMTGAITTIDMKQLSDRPEMDLLKMLQGQVPGLMISDNGELGVRPVVRIRGEASFENKQTSVNEPLYVLDGVIISSDAFLALNPEDFDEIKILKDASATALYGIKAANGVIEITSKRGIAGQRLISVGVRYGVTLRGPRGVDMMDSKEKLELERLIGNPAAPGYRYSEEYIRKQAYNDPNLAGLILAGQQKIDSLQQINTDWFKELIRINNYQSYSIGIRGGREEATYYYSANYSKQGGRVEGNDINRLSLRSNLDYKLGSNMDLSVNIGVGISETNTGNGSSYSPSTLVYNLNPYEQKNGEQTLFSYKERTYRDLLHQYEAKSTAKRFESSFVYHWQIIESLHLSAVAGVDYVLNEAKKITPATSYLERNYSSAVRGKLDQDKGLSSNKSSNVRLNYDKTWHRHALSASINTDYFESTIDNLGVTGHGLASGITTPSGVNQSLTDSYRASIRGNKITEAQLGFGVAAGYTYQEIYEFYGSYKRDASSLLPSGKRWNTAWSAGIGWQIGAYNIFRQQRVLSDMKLRLSYGNTAGMAGISMSSTLPVYANSNNIYGDGRVLALQALYNTELKPQQSGTFNGGMEATLFKKINVSIDLYRTEIKDALLNIPIGPSNGFTSMARNIGVLQNSGYEIRLSGNPIESDRFRWNTSISLSWNKNEVKQLYDGDKLYLSEGAIIPDYEVGEPIGIMYGLTALGINPLDGHPRFLSATGEELTYKNNLTREDFVMLGYTTPPYMGFFNNSFTAGAFSFSFDFYFSFGGIAAYSRSYVRDYAGAVYNAVKGQTEDMWFKRGDENKRYPTFNLVSSANYILEQPSTDTVYKTDFIRLNNARVSYLMPHHWVEKLGGSISYLRFFVQGQNLMTFNREKDKASLSNVVQPVISAGINISL